MTLIPSISVIHDSNKYVVYPRLELITDCLSNTNSIYKILCTVMNDGIQQCPIGFFNDLDSREIYIIYRHALENIRKQISSPVSINMSIKFLKSYYIEMLLSEFGRDTTILELAESCPLRSVLDVKDRIDEIRKYPNVRIWLDDSGVKYSNFDLMNAFDFDAVKISKEIFWDLHKNDNTLLKHIIKTLKKKTKIVVIEGVDSFDKYIFCKEQQCMMQGYFFNEINNSAVS